jgi:DNA invertase Pin-like site-specific DNA recombinase
VEFIRDAGRAETGGLALPWLAPKASSSRDLRDLHNIFGQLRELDCGFVSLGESWCDTTSDVGRLMITIMGGIAEFERGLIRKRCDEGIARTRFGRSPKLDPGQRRKIAERYAAGETMAELARDYDVSEPTIWRVLQGPFSAAA